MGKVKCDPGEPDNDEVPMEYPKGKAKKPAKKKAKAKKGGGPMGMHMNAKHVGRHS